MQIATGVSLVDYYGMLAAFGMGLDFCVAAGVMVHTGCAINQFSGPFISVRACNPCFTFHSSVPRQGPVP